MKKTVRLALVLAVAVSLMAGSAVRALAESGPKVQVHLGSGIEGTGVTIVLTDETIVCEHHGNNYKLWYKYHDLSPLIEKLVRIDVTVDGGSVVSYYPEGKGQQPTFTTSSEGQGPGTLNIFLGAVTPIGVIVVKKAPGEDSKDFPVGAAFAVTLTPEGDMQGTSYTSTELAPDNPVTFYVSPGTYRVSETKPDDRWDDPIYTLDTVTVAAFEETEVTISNTYAPGTIKITKANAGSEGFPVGAKFEVQVAREGWSSGWREVSLEVPVTFTDLLPGHYEVYERITGDFAGGFRPACVYPEAGFDLNRGDTKQITVKNTYSSVVGSIGVTKQMQDGDPLQPASLMDDEPMKFTVSVKYGDFVVETADIAVGGSYEFKNLPPGQYTVEEIVPEGFDTPLYSESNPVTVNADETTEVTITNRLLSEPTTGTITVHKGTAENSESFGSSVVFTVGVRRVDQNMVPTSADETTKSVTTEEPAVFSGLAPGSYEVFEIHPGTGWGGPLYLYNDSEYAEPVCIEVAGDDEHEVTVLNEYHTPTTQTRKLTVLYKLHGTDTELREPSEYEGVVDSKKTVYAPSISGYVLRSVQASSYEHTYGDEDDTHTFWYVVYSPPVTQYSTLTVRYMLSGTSTELRASDSYTREVGNSLPVTAPAIDGYRLRDGEASSKTHWFTSLDGQITFWYVAVGSENDVEPIDDELPPLLPGTGGMAASTLYGIGVSLVSLGMVLKRKRR